MSYFLKSIHTYQKQIQSKQLVADSLDYCTLRGVRRKARQRAVSFLTSRRGDSAYSHGWFIVNMVAPLSAILSSTSLT